MALSAFDDRSAAPQPAALSATLGRSAALWDAARQRLAADFAGLSEEWGFAGKAFGWSLRLKQKKRAIVYLTPCEKHFLASFALGEKACRAARDAALAPQILAAIDTAPRYTEGRGLRIPVRTRAQLEQVLRVAHVKMAN
jgi:hypothetical protein